MKINRALLLLTVYFAVGLSLCEAQTSFGTIVGFVQDQSGRAVNNAKVEVQNTATGVVSTVRTQSDEGVLISV